VERSECGWLFERHISAREVADLIEGALDLDALRAAGSRARRHFLATFTEEGMVRGIRDVYREAVKANPERRV
jgi:hypothetical protein